MLSNYLMLTMEKLILGKLEQMQNIGFDEKNPGVYEVMTELDRLWIIEFQKEKLLKIKKFLSIFFTNKETSIKKEKIGDLLTPEGAAKPLTLTKQEIGRNTWALLHSMAASYPNEPTDEDKKQITNFMYGLANLFPCKICGGHLLKMLKKEGVKANSREELVNYICKIHT